MAIAAKKPNCYSAEQLTCKLVHYPIAAKVAKGGEAYARGKGLVVMAEGVGTWTPRIIAQGLPSSVHFSSLYVVAIAGHDGGVYSYDVCRISLDERPSPRWRVVIGKDFDSWMVTP